MKKIVIAMSLLLVSCVAAAQREAGRFSLVPRVGVSLSNLTDTEFLTDVESNSTVKSRFKAGMAAGADIEYAATEKMGIAVGAYYAMQGYRYPDLKTFHDGQFNADIRNYRANMAYLNLPVVLFGYVFPHLAIKAGVEFGINLSSKLNEDNRVWYDTPGDQAKQSDYKNTVTDMKDITRRTIISVPVGLSYEYRNFVLDARYNLGMTKVYDGLFSEVVKSKNRSIVITLGYRLDL